MRFAASELAEALGGTLVGPDVQLDGAAFDSRALRPGQLFVPIVAERDGHEFVAAAVVGGAPAYLTSCGPIDGVDATAILVGDTQTALLAAARWARGRTEARVVGITGSVGKTSTKDLAAAALGATLAVAANERSFNNELGLPVTILCADDQVDVLVLEMGMRGFGEIAALCDIARPEVGVVTAVGSSHTGRVGGIEGVARAKRELVESLEPAGTAILNADDERVEAMAQFTAAGVVRYGESSAADVRVTGLELDDLARPRFDVRTPWGDVHVALAVSGAHMASNAAAAIAVAGVVGTPLDAVVETLATTEISEHRMQLRRATSGALVVNDAYNANPTSVSAALEALAAMAARRRIAVLGLMAELDDPEQAHRDVAELARSLRIELVAFRTALYDVEPVDDPIAALAELGPVGEGDAVLFKASLVAGLAKYPDQVA